VLAELGVSKDDSRIIEYWNKADLLGSDERDMYRTRSYRRRNCILGSALKGEGLDALLATIEEHLAAKLDTFEVALCAAEGRGLAWLHENGEVLSRQSRLNGDLVVTVRLAPERAAQAIERFGARLRLADSLSRAAE
jgi:GTP-binding protein HflX